MRLQMPFYVIDFDRTLGSVEANTKLLVRSVNDIVGDNLLVGEMQKTIVELSDAGLAFDAYGYLLSRTSADTVDKVMERFEMLGQQSIENLREKGVSEFLEWMRATERSYCIMSYGSPDWQTAKVRAAGLGDAPLIIVNSPDKVAIINSWQNSAGEYDVSVGFSRSRQFKQIVLIDDKAKAFANIDTTIRGYHVAKEPLLLSQQGQVSPDVVRVMQINEIIQYETKL
jgi:hypothetical protein